MRWRMAGSERRRRMVQGGTGVWEGEGRPGPGNKDAPGVKRREVGRSNESARERFRPPEGWKRGGDGAAPQDLAALPLRIFQRHLGVVGWLRGVGGVGGERIPEEW